MKFELVGQPQEEDVIRFSTKIDGDGDLAITANGINLIFISHSSRHLHRYALDSDEMEQLAGLEFDENRIVTD